MIKMLPSIEKEFNMQEVDKATPNWLKVIMFVFVILLFIGFSLAEAGDICTLKVNSHILLIEGDTLTQVDNDIPLEVVIQDDEFQPPKNVTAAISKLFGEDWSDGVTAWDEAYNDLIVHKADLTYCLSDSPELIIPAE